MVQVAEEEDDLLEGQEKQDADTNLWMSLDGSNGCTMPCSDSAGSIDGSNDCTMPCTDSTGSFERRPSIGSNGCTEGRRPSIGSDPNNLLDQHRTTCDAVRASGTVANITGILAPAAHVALGAVSCVGGVVGASAGLAQLNQGLNTPSGKKDPHLIAKGSVTTGVGATCMVIGACATAVPPLFFVAAGLGAAGLGTAIALDANVDGLCLDCRNNKADDEEEKPQGWNEWWRILPWINNEGTPNEGELSDEEVQRQLSCYATWICAVLANHEDYEFRREAAWFLGEFRDKKIRAQIVPELIRALREDKHFSVRQAAANTLGKWRAAAKVLKAEFENLKEQEELFGPNGEIIPRDQDRTLREVQHLKKEIAHAIQLCAESKEDRKNRRQEARAKRNSLTIQQADDQLAGG